MPNNYIFDGDLETNIPSIIYSRLDRAEDISDWVEDFSYIFSKFYNVYVDSVDERDRYKFDLYLNDRTGKFAISCLFTGDPVTLTPMMKEEIEDIADMIIDNFNQYCAGKKMCKVPEYYSLLYLNGTFYVPFYENGNSSYNTDMVAITDTIRTADIEWFY